MRSAVLAAMAGVLVTFALCAWIRGREMVAERRSFEASAEQVSRALQLHLQLQFESLHAIPALFDAAQEVSRADFKTFVQASLARHPSIYAFEWIPVVPADGRAAVEASARADGLAGFQFKDDTGRGQMVRAPEREEYLPILYMEPPNPVPLGFDVGSEAPRRAPMDKARDTGKPVASPRIRLVEDPEDVYSVAIFQAVFRPGAPTDSERARRLAIRGYAVEVFRVRPVVERALAGMELAGTQVGIVDDDAPAELRLLHGVPGGAGCWGACVTWTRPFQMADRSWTMTFTRALPAWYDSPRALAVLLAGIALSVLLGLVLHGLTTIRSLRKQVHEARRLGQYTLEDKLGEGAMGVVYTARHTLLRRPTAIKLLPPGRGAAHHLARFEREVQLTAQLTHPNTIAVYDYGHSPDGVFYYAMEFVDGLTLEDLVQVDGPQPAGRVVRILEQVCGSLAEAHEVGLVHRDIKPANIMICKRAGICDFVKVLDFGLAKELEGAPDAPELSSTGAIVGTPLYIAPEAVTAPDTIDARADVYAVGAVAYMLLAGRPVFEGDTVVDVCSQHLYAEPARFSSDARQVPAELETIVLRCLAKKPDERFASAGELLRALRDCDLPGWPDAEWWWRERGATVKAAARRRSSPASPSRFGSWVSGARTVAVRE